ncbi:MAG: hydantoinase B/oxoprolinase family protein [Kiloniellales bacterium]|nr:hydantoinase B/oxoprolinase family protein [Kiloniellales bacterium]
MSIAPAISVDLRLDPVTVEVVRNKLEGISNEMQLKLIRSSFSPLVKEGFDAAASLFTTGGEVLSLSLSVPGHLSASIPCVRALLDAFPLASAKEGDIYIMNDPYLGGTHIPDIAMVVPVFHEGRPIAVSCTITHHQDLGGMVPGSLPTNATDIYQEGLRIPPVKLRDAGVENETLVGIIRQNVRFPDMLMGDLNAQTASCTVGARRLTDLAADFDPDLLQRIFDDLLDRSEHMTRESFRAIPNGTYRYTDHFDNDGIELDRRVRIQVRIDVSDDSIHVDFEGTDKQLVGPFNCVPSASQSGVYFALRAIAGPDIPSNGGCFRPISIHLPRGSFVNPVEPAPVNSRSAAIKRIAGTILGAFRDALPDRIPADSAGELLLLIFAGQRDDESRYITGELLVGGSGASVRSDGVDVIETDNTNCTNIPIETLELGAPIRVLRSELRRDSGGPGRYRGGLGLVKEFELLEGSMTLTHRGERHFHPAQGYAGGAPGACARSVIRRRSGAAEEIPSKIVTELAAGDRLVVETAGGGGFGEPGARARASLALDRADEKVSQGAAEALFGRPENTEGEPSNSEDDEGG